MNLLESRIYPISTLAAVVMAMRAEGIAIEQALLNTDVRARELDSAASRISISQLLTVYRNALRFSCNPRFAVDLGRSMQVTKFGIYGYAMLSSPTQRALIELVQKYQRLAPAAAGLAFREETQSKVGIWTISPLQIESMERGLYRFIIEYYLGTIMSITRDILDKPDLIKREIRLSYPYSDHLPPYEEIFGCPVLFAQSANEMRFNTDCLDVPTRCHDPITFETVRKLCTETLDKMELRAGLSGELRQMLLESTGRFPGIEAICQQLGVSARTLRRKLHAEGISYGELVNETRILLAKRYLRETVMTIHEIAERIGYSDPSNFIRAFSRGTGVTPAAYRRDGGLAGTVPLSAIARP